MSKQDFYQILQQETQRVDKTGTAKRHEHIIESFTEATEQAAPQAVIEGKNYRVFNSNDYLGMRHREELKEADHQATEQYGTGPGAVRFISGSLKIHRDLERALARFHGRDDAIVISSAFATNMAVLSSLITDQSRDSVMGNDVLVISDELNHRSIIDGIRLANHPKEKRKIFEHMNAENLAQILEGEKGKHKRALVVTDGVFSMLGEYQDLAALRDVVDQYDQEYEQGVLLIVDDAHGVGAFGESGQGTEEVSGGRADVLVGTLGKAFGADGGYVVADQVVIDYLREAGATYIYSNSIAPGSASAALTAVKILSSEKGHKLLNKLRENIGSFKKQMQNLGFVFASDSIHPIQPLLLGDAQKAKALTDALYQSGILVTNISYPVVPKGKDEVRVQLSAAHTPEDIEYFVAACQETLSETE